MKKSLISIFSAIQLAFRTKQIVIPCLLLGLLLNMVSCKSTKYVPEDSYLLRDNKVIVTEKRTITADNIMPYVYQKPNRKMVLGLRFYLGLYNLASNDTSKWVNRTLRSWGEAPVILDSTAIKSSVKNIEQYMRTRGFYYAQVRDTIIYKKKKAKVHYIVSPNQPYRLRNVSYSIADTSILKIVLNDTASSTLRQRRRFSNEMLENEQERLTSLLRNNGYYAFNRSFITYEADTMVGQSMVDLDVRIANLTTIDSGERKTQVNHRTYKINDVYIYTNYYPIKLYSDSTYMNTFDTLYTKNLHLIYDDALNLRPGVISRANLIYPGMQYKDDDVKQTYNNFNNLSIFNGITIQFRELNETDSTGNVLIDCVVQLSPMKKQSMKADFEVSISSSDLIGFSPGIHYGHRNLFKGGELFSLDFRGVLQYSLPGSTNFQNSFEYNAATSISVPKFLAPFRLNYFKTQLPHTRFASSYTYQQRPDYTRSVAAFNFGYLWNNSSKLSFIFNPIDFNMVKMLSLDSDFYKNINDPYLQSTYKDHFILGMTGSAIYSNQTQSDLFGGRRAARRNAVYFRVNGDIAGNILSLFNSVLKTNDSTHMHMIMGTDYSQYAKADFNLTFNKPVQNNSSLATRFVFGIGKAYGNSNSLPLEKMFYAGGANSLRGWPIRGVGPGSTPQAVIDTTFSIPNQVADMRLEANIEYRFPLFWLFEGAAFIDAGNIWSISPDDTREGARFTSQFYKEIAANTGLGLRFNIVYFVVRLDMGLRFHDPGRPESQRFIAPQNWLKGDNYNFHLGINFPF